MAARRAAVALKSVPGAGLRRTRAFATTGAAVRGHRGHGVAGTCLPPAPAYRVAPCTRGVRCMSGTGGESTLDVDDATVAYASKTTQELWRAWMVLGICNIGLVVRHSDALVKASRAVLGNERTARLLKATFFGHFCAGEDAAEIVPTLRRLADSGVGAILDYAVEADVADGDAASNAHDESECDANAEISLAAIDAAAQQHRGFAAIKLTALGKPELLQHISSILLDIKAMFRDITHEDGKSYTTRGVDVKGFTKGLAELGMEFGFDEQFASMDQNADGSIDFMEWVDSLDPRTLGRQPLKSYVRTPVLSDVELQQLDNVIERLGRLVEAASERKVRLMIDAEQTYMQPAIDHIVMQLQRKYNTGPTPVVFNTYQAYLTDCEERLLVDLKRAQRDNFTFACKLVRGAYMVKERRLAEEGKYTSPVHPKAKDTHACYHRCVDILMDHRHISEFVVASHNETSVKYAVSKMQELGIASNGGGVYFGQLLGMCDNVSFALGAAGYEVFKYVPYGPVFEVLPYLIRRAEENSGLLGSAAKERRMIRGELWRRMRS